MPVKRFMIFGPCRETSYTAITLNQESNFTRRQKNHSLFHWSTLTFPELHIRIWMSSKKNAYDTNDLNNGPSMEDPVVLLERNLYGHPLEGLLWERHFEKIFLKYGWEKVPNWECLFVHRERGLFLSVFGWQQNWLERNKIVVPMWKLLNKEVDLPEPTSFLDHVYLVHSTTMWNKQRYCGQLQKFASRISAVGTEKLPSSKNLSISSWSYDLERHAKKCVERYCELANKIAQQLYKVSTPCIEDHHFKEEDMKSVGELSHVCSQIVLKCLYLARIGRPDILWSVNKLARSITKWTKACDKRLNRLISYIHHTCEYKQYCRVGNIAKQCRLRLFQDSDFEGDLEDSKSTSGGTLCISGSRTFVPMSWMCKKQNFSFAQFNRIWNYLTGHWIEIGWFACSGIIGSNCFCFLETSLKFQIE